MNTQLILNFAANCMNVAPELVRLESVAGGDINNSFLAISRDAATGNAEDRLFIKSNNQVDVLQAEYNALLRIKRLNVAHYPDVVSADFRQSVGLLALKYYVLQPLNAGNAISVAQSLAHQHSITQAKFGWPEPGYIGYSVQHNQLSEDWIDFFTHQRLEPQLRKTRGQALSAAYAARIESLMVRLSQYIDTDSITPSLLHGDLWSGNVSFNADYKIPLFYDPAPYFGDSEADIAMTQLFGSLPSTFYRQYRELRPQPEDYDDRSAIYNLYHALNHVAMFGRGYLGLVDSLLSRLRL